MSITEQGGRVCHASIIAREYNIPCVVGCREFIRLLKDGEYILLDAYNGIVYK